MYTYASDGTRFKLRDTEPEKFCVCKSTAYRILKDLCQQKVLERYGKRYRLAYMMKLKLSGIEFDAKRRLLKQLLDYLGGAFNIPAKLFVDRKIKRDLIETLDIPPYLLQDIAL